jgi:hypothetical protein
MNRKNYNEMLDLFSKTHREKLVKDFLVVEEEEFANFVRKEFWEFIKKEFSNNNQNKGEKNVED